MSRPRFLPGPTGPEEPWQLVIPNSLWLTLSAHLFPGDGDEHGAVISAGVVRSPRGVRLLARELFIARDDIEFIPSERAYRRLSPTFVNERIRHCRDEQLAYLAIHNHSGRTAVRFSEPDLRSHERGYPALLDIARGVPVGALVLASEALAGDIWTPDGVRRPIGETVILGRNLSRIYPQPAAAPPAAAAIDDRQARVYGVAGQALLARLKVGVIGAGGVGLPIISMLARLGVGHIVAIDPDRVELSNLPRLPESTRADAMAWLCQPGRPHVLQALGRRLATPKVGLARRVARRARKTVTVDALRTDVSDPLAARELLDCDFLFLAADTHLARAVFNSLVYGALIPGLQIGSKVALTPDGAVESIFSIVRPVTPDGGCLWCNQLINPARLTEETLSADLRTSYLPEDDAPAPSVITLNAEGAARAADHFMLSVTGLLRPTETAGDYRRFDVREERLISELPAVTRTVQSAALGRPASAPAATAPASRSARARGKAPRRVGAGQEPRKLGKARRTNDAPVDHRLLVRYRP